MKLIDVYKKYNENADAFFDALKQEVIKLGTENPDFVYNTSGVGRCYYNRGSDTGPGCKGCIFGQALQNMGWDDKYELFIEMNLVRLFTNLISDNIITYDSHFLVVQQLQDEGHSWGEAIKTLLSGKLK